MGNPVELLLAEARKHGLEADREPAFLLWVGNEVFEGREVESLQALTARARELVLMFGDQDRQSAKR